MAAYWCYFSWIIANSITIVYCLLTKLGTKMYPYTTFLFTKFQGNQITHFHFMITFIPWRKEEENKVFPIFESLYFRNPWCDLVKIWNVGYWQWRESVQQKSSGFIQAAQNFVYLKIALLFFLYWCGVLASWATHHTTVCLDYSEDYVHSDFTVLNVA